MINSLELVDTERGGVCWRVQSVELQTVVWCFVLKTWSSWNEQFVIVQ